jgi:hypothetical protein
MKSGNVGEIVVRFEWVKTIAKQVTDDLERDALRTIRQRDPDKGMLCLQKIEGIQQFMDTLEQATGSGFYRQDGSVQQENIHVLRSHDHSSSGRRKRRGGVAAD